MAIGDMAIMIIIPTIRMDIMAKGIHTSLASTAPGRTIRPTMAQLYAVRPQPTRTTATSSPNTAFATHKYRKWLGR